MWIVKDASEDQVRRATEKAGLESKRLADAIEGILALKRTETLTVEIIEQAIEKVN